MDRSWPNFGRKIEIEIWYFECYLAKYCIINISTIWNAWIEKKCETKTWKHGKRLFIWFFQFSRESCIKFLFDFLYYRKLLLFWCFMETFSCLYFECSFDFFSSLFVTNFPPLPVFLSITLSSNYNKSLKIRNFYDAAEFTFHVVGIFRISRQYSAKVVSSWRNKFLSSHFLHFS